MPKAARRGLQLNIRVSKEDMERLVWLARYYGISCADVVRMKITELYRELSAKEAAKR